MVVEILVPVAGQARISLKPKPGNKEGLPSGSGALVEVEFRVSSEAPVNSTSPLNLALVRLSDRYGRDFATSALQVEVTTTGRILTVEAGSYTVNLPLVLQFWP